MDFKQWVEGLMNEHRNPTVKFVIKKTKLFSTNVNHDEDTQVEERLECFKRVLTSERVDRRCARNKLIWMKDEHLAKLSKKLGSKTAFMGYVNKSGIYLYPEEAMFLLETNRAEILWNSVPINMDMAFSIIIDSVESLDKYKAYKKLMLKGFTLKRNKISNEKEVHNSPKKFKKDNTVDQQISVPDGPSKFKEMFMKLQLKGPKCNNDKVIEKECDYKMTQILDGSKREFNLNFISTTVLDPEIAYRPGDSNIYCSVDNDVLFSRFISVKLPSLI